MVIGVATLVTRFLLPTMFRSPVLAQMVLLLGVAVMVTGIWGLLLARRATQRMAETGHMSGLTLATLGTWIGWGNVGLTVAGFFLGPIGNILGSLPR